MAAPSRALAALLAAVLAAPLAAVARPAAAADEARPRRPGPAYWLASADGGVFAFGRAAFAGAAGATPLRSSIAGMAATPTGEGYWLAGHDGGVFAFGDAGFHGGLAGVALKAPVVDVAATPSGAGYWLATADGGVFAFGDAAWVGGASGTTLSAPVTAIAATPTGRGYWLVGRDGGVFAFGDARWLGGASGAPLTRPVADAAATPSGNGYWLVGTDGGVFAFGDAGFHGSALGASERAVVSIAPTPSGLGYWLASSGGGVFAFGDAGFYGSAADGEVARTVVGITSGVGRAVPAPAGGLASTFGWDVSWPQCGTPLPGGPRGYAIVGVTDGHLYDMNPCLAEQHRWSTRDGSLGGLYVNVNWPSRAAEPGLAARMADVCAEHDLGCQLYEWGRRGMDHAVDGATALGVHSPMWWLDVETANRWSPDTAANARIIQGAIDGLQRRGLRVGIYSTSYQWGVIAGGFSPGLPNWVAGPVDVAGAERACRSGPTFAGGVAWIVQYPFRGFDGNLMCEAGMSEALRSFRLPPAPPVPELPAAPVLARVLAPMRAV